MLTTLALVVFIASIFLFFSQELIDGIKRVFEIKGAKLFFPLAIASWAVYHFDSWFIWVVSYYKDLLEKAWSIIHNFLPESPLNTRISAVVVLATVSVVPVFIWDFITRKKTYKGYQHPYITSTIIWIISTLLLILVVKA